MDLLLYCIWIGFPVLFLLIALWSKLEQKTIQKAGKRENKEPGDILKQFFFVSGCSLVVFLLDRYLSNSVVAPMLPSFIPLPMYRLLLYPVVLYLAAVSVGGSKPIRITKSSHPSRRNKR